MDFNQSQAIEIKKILSEGIAELGLAVSAGQQQQLLDYLELMAKWNKVYNLTAVRDKIDMVRQHLLDSLAVAPLLRGPRVLDVGSGGGLPGVVLAIISPDIQVVTVDKVHKKIAFQTQVAAELGLKNLKPLSCRVEDLGEQPFDTITSRAFSSLSDFVQCTLPLLAVNGEWSAMKGVYPQDEIELLPGDIKIKEVIKIAVPGLEAERHLVRMVKQ